MKNTSHRKGESHMRHKFFEFMANGLAGYLDFALGILYAIAISAVYLGPEVPVPLSYLLLGIFFSLLPDIDIIPAILWNIFFSKGRRRMETNRHHYWLTHRPLLMVPTGMILGYLLADWYGVILAFAGVTSHFLHDRLFGGDLNLFWPAMKDLPTPDTSGADWLEIHWMRPSVRSVIEITLGTVIAIPVLFIGGFPLLSLFTVVGLAAAVIPMWILHPRTHI